MEKEKKNKISLSTYLLVLAVLVIAVMAVFIYMQKVNANREIEGLKNDAEVLKNTVAELQGKLDSISNIANTSEEKNNSEEVSTETITQEISGPGYSAKLENDTIIVTLKSQDGLWMDSDFSKPINNKTYMVEGLEKGIKKIVNVNRGFDVCPEIFVLMNDGSIYSVNISRTIDIMFGSKNPNDIKFTANKVEEFKDIVDIFGYEDGHYAIDKNGKKITIFDESRGN